MLILEHIHNHSKLHPTKMAITSYDGSLTYEELWNYIELTASYAKRYNLKKGDRVIVQNRQNVGFIILQLAMLYYGCAVCPVDEKASEDYIKKIANEINAKHLFLVKDYDITIDGIKNLTKYVEKISFSMPDDDMEADILYTTGTTGNPEGIVHTHRSHYATIENIIGILEINNINNLLLAAPLHHAFALRRIYANLVLGFHSIILKSIMPLKDFFTYLSKYDITAIVINPSAMSIILQYGKKYLAEYKNQLQYIEFSSSPLKKDVVDELINILPKTHQYNTYGSSEAATTLSIDMLIHNAKSGCIGKPTKHTKILILDNNGEEITGYGIENKGYLAVIGKSIMKCYVNKSKKQPHNNLYISKDIIYRDEEGFYYLVGRDDDIIITGGYKISPEEIEDIAVQYHGVTECACIAKPDKTAGHVPVLFIKINEGYIENDFYKYLSKYLESYMYPKEVRIIDEIPKTFNGKILRRTLKELL